MARTAGAGGFDVDHGNQKNNFDIDIHLQLKTGMGKVKTIKKYIKKAKELAMRHVTTRIALLTAALMIVALPVLAADAVGGKMMQPAQEGGKVERLLVAVNGCDRLGTPEERINKITDEINKGTAVYTNDELRILNNELDKAISDVNDAYGGGA